MFKTLKSKLRLTHSHWKRPYLVLFPRYWSKIIISRIPHEFRAPVKKTPSEVGHISYKKPERWCSYQLPDNEKSLRMFYSFWQNTWWTNRETDWQTETDRQTETASCHGIDSAIAQHPISQFTMSIMTTIMVSTLFICRSL